MEPRRLLAGIIVVAGLCIIGSYAGVASCYFASNPTSSANAATAWTSETWNETTTAEFDAGLALDVDTGGDEVRLTGCPYLYALRGNGASAFWRYDPSSDMWTGMTPAPGAIGAGGALVYTGGDFIYALRGGSTRDFYRYSISADSWSSMSLTPDTVGGGGSLAFDGTYIYALRGGLTLNFWRYDIAANTWTSRADIPKIADPGAAISCQGGTLFAVRGGQQQDFYRYAVGTGAWSAAQRPGSGYEPGDGGALANNGTHLFLHSGDDKHNDRNRFSIYGIASNSWVHYTTPFQVDAGGALASDGTTYVYALGGGSTTGFWRYNTAANTWAAMAATPGAVGWGGSLVYVPVTGSTRYASPGSVASIVFDTAAANSRWDMLAWNASIPSGTAIAFEARASDTPFPKDAATPGWTPVTGTLVDGRYVQAYPNLPSGRYHQWRAALSSTPGSGTPVLNDVTVYYSNRATIIDGMSGLTLLAAGLSAWVGSATPGPAAPVEIPSGIVDPNSLPAAPEPTDAPILIAAGNATETPVPTMATPTAAANVTQTAAPLVPATAPAVQPIDIRAANATLVPTPGANASEARVPATATPIATANVTRTATATPTPDVTAIPIETVAMTAVPTVTSTGTPAATPTPPAPLVLPVVASTDRNLTTFVNLTRQAGLDPTLSGLGPYTVFAPTDDAFRALPPGYLAGLRADPASLARVLKRHVVEDALGSAELAGISTVRTLDGTDLNVTALHGVVKVGGATVNYTDIRAGNGVIHAIDAVLLPADTPVTTMATPSTAAATPTATLATVIPVAAASTEATALPQTTAPSSPTPTSRGKHYPT